MSKKLKVEVVAGKELTAKNKGTSSPYCEVYVFNEKGEKACTEQRTAVVKESLNPQWNQNLTFILSSEPKETFTLQVRCWDKHVIIKDKFLGQFTVTFNSKLVSSTEAIDHWFPLTARMAQEVTSGSIHLRVQYGDILKNSTAGLTDGISVAEKLGLTSSTSGANNSSVGSSNNSNNNNNRAGSSNNSNNSNNSDHAISRPAEDAVLPKGAINEEVIENLIDSGKAFIVHSEDGDDTSYEKSREGPPTTQMRKIGNAQLALNKGNLQVHHNTNNYSLQGARADGIVHSGKWYFEVTLEANGQAQIGWCTQDFDGVGAGDSWAFDGSRQQKLRNMNGIQYGQNWSNGDVIGVFLDMKGPTLRFSRNGNDLGEAYGPSEMGRAKALSPYCLLSRNMRVTFNFGATPFRYVQHAFNPLHSFLEEKQVQVLAQLFNKYCSISNQNQEDDADFEPAIFEAGTDKLMEDLGILDDMDPGIFIIAWKLSCATPWVIARSEWMNGWSIHAASTVAEMKSKLDKWRKDLQDNKVFTIFYNWIFEHMRGDKRVLDWEQTKILWQVVLSGRKWPMFSKWLEFLEETKTKAVNQDLWSMIWEFIKAFPKDVSTYDVNDSAWPGKIDEFVEFLEGKGDE